MTQKIKREIVKRMLLKDKNPDYIHEITNLSKKQIKHLSKVQKSYVGNYELYLRKKYASNHHLEFSYYFEDITKFYTGVSLKKSEFYKNKYIQMNPYKKHIFIDIEKQYRNSVMYTPIYNSNIYLNEPEEIIKAVHNIHQNDNIYRSDYPLYNLYGCQFEKIEIEKNVLDILTVENNLKKIAFICELSDEQVENIIKNNSIFMSKSKLNKNKLEKELEIWEDELKMEVAKRFMILDGAIGKIKKITGFDEQKLNEIRYLITDRYSDEFQVRKDIAEKLAQYEDNFNDISEITGIREYQLDSSLKNPVYDRYIKKYYEKNGDKELIIPKKEKLNIDDLVHLLI